MRATLLEPPSAVSGVWARNMSEGRARAPSISRAYAIHAAAPDTDPQPLRQIIAHGALQLLDATASWPRLTRWLGTCHQHSLLRTRREGRSGSASGWRASVTPPCRTGAPAAGGPHVNGAQKLRKCNAPPTAPAARIHAHRKNNVVTNAAYAVLRTSRGQLSENIACAKCQVWDALLAGIDSDPWGRSYKFVMDKLCPWEFPATELIDSAFLEENVGTLFPRIREGMVLVSAADHPVNQRQWTPR